MAALNWVHSGVQEQQPSMRELAHGRLAREAAAEGMVLLRNEGLLPLSGIASIALFGGGAVYTIKGGTGSGDVNSRESISIYQGLKDAGAVIANEGWIVDYQRRYLDARNAWKKKVLADAKQVENPFDAYAANPFSMPEGRRIAAEDLAGASVAIYVVSRISGEGKDRRKEEGDYYLSQKEAEDLHYLDQSGLPILLVLNVGAPLELTGLLEETRQIRGILNISLPGQEGGHAFTDVLFGRAAPGGRLTATWARRYEDYPSAASFGYLDGDLEKEEYREGIYVGYRYFSSFGIEPLFPFGYGLAYTDFSITCEKVEWDGTAIQVVASVKNTGSLYAGREVVQVYATPPQTGCAKECQRLVGFAKTAELKPQETQKLYISIALKSLAGYAGQSHAWVIEEGLYGIWIGRHAGSLKLVAAITASGQVLLEQAGEIFPQAEGFPELGASAFAQKRAREWTKRAKREGIPQLFINVQEEEGQKEKQIKRKTSIAMAQPVEELIPALYGNITYGASTLGSSGIRVPGSAGETTEAWEKTYGIPSLIMADGPAGLRLRQSYEVDRRTGRVYGASVLGSLESGFLEEDERHEEADTYYQYCTAFPVGTALAQSWDRELMRRFGEAIAVEMEEFHVSLWLAPGMNIHRNPLCGRNFEYYAEDPLLSGIMAAAVTEGVQSHKGCGVAIKHFVCNNQEDNRMSVDVRVSERALREIYLRGFEIAVKESQPAVIMSSYNKINGVHAANSRELCTTVARKEWGFEGVIISDWNTTVPEDGSVPWRCVAAGNDIIMPGNEKDDENIRKAYAEGQLSEGEIRRSAGRLQELAWKLAGPFFIFQKEGE